MATDAGIERFVVPDSPSGDGWADFRELTEVHNVCLRVGDRRDRELTPEYLLGTWREAGQKEPEVVVARVDGHVVGVADYERDTPDVAPTGWLTVDVLPAFRRRGIGAALYDAIEAVALADGRNTLIAEFSSPPRDGATVTATTGSGEVPADDPGVRFALARGYALGQVERVSVCSLPVSAAVLDELEASAAPRAADYRVVTWRGATPDDRAGDLAMLRARMSTDTPAGDIDWPEEIWDAARVRADEARRLDAGADFFMATAEHMPSGRLVAFSDLTVRPSGTTAQQGDTLVLTEHRGHRLGTLVKVANLRALQSAHPELTGVMTGNATDNSYMLSINDALGFETFVFDGVWQKTF